LASLFHLCEQNLNSYAQTERGGTVNRAQIQMTLSVTVPAPCVSVKGFVSEHDDGV